MICSFLTLVFISDKATEKELLNSSLGVKISKCLHDVYDNYGNYEKTGYKNFISKEDYYYLNYREADKRIKRENNISRLTDVYITGNVAKAKYSYVYNAYDKNGEELYGDGTVSEPIIQEIELRLVENSWKIVNVYEKP